jgi:hypothetical protein
VIKIFSYLQELDCFIVDPIYKKIADHLGLTEWNEVVWIGRFFTLDNDYGEHWFDNWELREPFEDKATELGLDTTELFILNPNRFKNDLDGPCHTPEERLLFWKDVLTSLHLSYGTLFREARKLNQERKQVDHEDYIPDLEERITELLNSNYRL